MALELEKRPEAQHLLTTAVHKVEEVLGIKVPWALAHIDEDLTPVTLADHIPGYGLYEPLDIPYSGIQEGPIIYARNPQELAEKIEFPEPPLVVASGPSTSGQSTTVIETMKRLRKAGIACDRVMTATDKKIDRPAEKDYYHYLSREEFDEWIAGGLFVEHTPSLWGDRYGTPIANLSAVLDARPALAFLIVDNDGSRDVERWMHEHYPNHPVVRYFTLRKGSPLSLAVNVMMKRQISDFLPRLQDALGDIHDAGAQPDFDFIASNLPEPTGIPVRTSETLATYFLEHLQHGKH